MLQDIHYHTSPSLPGVHRSNMSFYQPASFQTFTRTRASTCQSLPFVPLYFPVFLLKMISFTHNLRPFPILFSFPDYKSQMDELPGRYLNFFRGSIPLVSIYMPWLRRRRLGVSLQNIYSVFEKNPAYPACQGVLCPGVSC